MRERLTSRVGRIISGSFNALVDAVENTAPEMVMGQAIREIDEAIEEVRAELGVTIANKHLANTRLMQINQKCEELAERIELAVDGGRDDLAEVAISQQMDLEAQIPILENQISELSGTEKELEGYISALQGKKREMCQELEVYKASRQQSIGESVSGGGKGESLEGRVSKAESAFRRVLAGSAGLAGGLDTPDRRTAAQLKELEDMARTNRVKERLAAIKKNRG